MSYLIRKYNLLLALTFIVVLPALFGCENSSSNKSDDAVNSNSGHLEYVITKMEAYIPIGLSDTNHIFIWRTGSIYYSERLSALIIDKEHLHDEQLLCHYMTFAPIKPTAFMSWKYADIFELKLANTPFKYPPKQKMKFSALDSISFDPNKTVEGIEANDYFFKEVGSNEIYLINKNYNHELIDNVVKLFSQISKREHVQTFALTKDSIDYLEVNLLIREGTNSYCLNEDGENTNQQSMRGGLK